MSHTLDIFRKISFDDNIIKREFHSYQPRTQHFSNCDEVRIVIQHQDIYTLPCESYLYVSGSLDLNAAGNAVGNADPALRKPGELVRGSLAFLFNEIRYELNGVEIDRIKDPGIICQLKNLPSHSQSDWGRHIQLTSDDDKKFYMLLPLNLIMGFMEDYKSIVIGKQELILLRSRNDIDSYQAANEVPLTIDKVEWRIPHIQLSDEKKVHILSKLQSEESIMMPYRRMELHELPSLRSSTRDIWSVKSSTQLEKPRYIIIALQKENRRDVAKGDATLFDHARIRNIKVFLNSEAYPYDNMNLNFAEGNYIEAYRMFYDFQKSYYGRMNELIINEKSFKDHCMFIFDVSKQNETLKSGTVDLKIEFESDEAFPRNTRAYCLIIHDAIVEYAPITGMVRKLI